MEKERERVYACACERERMSRVGNIDLGDISMKI